MRTDQRTYSLFCAACFVLAVKSVNPIPLEDDEPKLEAVMKILIKRWRSRPTSREQWWYSRMLVKVSRACFQWLELSPRNTSSLADDLSSSIIRSSVGELVAESSAAVPGRSCFSEAGVLELNEFVLLRTSSQTEIPRQYLLVLANRVKAWIGGQKSTISDVCVRILKKLAPRSGVSSIGPVVFGIGLDLVLDPDFGTDGGRMCEVLPKPAVSVLVSREPPSRPMLVSKPEIAEFSGLDFVSVLAALSMRDSSLRVWRRLCLTV